MLVNLDDYRDLARRRLPKTVFDVIEGGGADELTLRRNRSAFEHLLLRPRSLGDTNTRDLSTTVFGDRVSIPLLLGPAGLARMAHRHGELAVARAAARADVIYAVGTATSYELEDIATSTTQPKWFQLYPPSDRGECAALISRAQLAGFKALCVTVDGSVNGLRERDRRNHLTVPLRVTPRLVTQALARPRWALDFARGGVGRGAQGTSGLSRNDVRRSRSWAEGARAIAATVRSVTVGDIEFIRSQWTGPLVIKGVHRADEVDLMLGLGADGLVVSNHGGRQLDTVLSSIEALPEVVHEVGGRAQVFVDGGFRRGTDVVKALALGARAVLVGRPYFHGLAIGGERGVADVIATLRSEIDNTMALLGCASIVELNPTYVQALPGFAGRHVDRG